MLRKLMKHEFKATGRFFLPAFAVFAAMLVLERLSILFLLRHVGEQNFFGVLSSIVVNTLSALTIVGLIALLAAPVIYGIVRFYRNMLCDEGYLSFTLPVTASQHLWSKMLVSCIWQVATVLVVGLCGVLYFMSVDYEQVAEFFSQLGYLLGMAGEAGGFWGILLLVLLVLAVLSQLPTSYLSLYSAMSIGQCVNKHKMLASIGVYMACNVAVTTLIQVIASAVAFMSLNWIDEIDAFFSNPALFSDTTVLAFQLVSVFIGAMILFNVLLALGYFMLSRHFLTKKLNLA